MTTRRSGMAATTTRLKSNERPAASPARPEDDTGARSKRSNCQGQSERAGVDVRCTPGGHAGPDGPGSTARVGLRELRGRPAPERFDELAPGADRGRAHPSTPSDAPPLRRSEARLSGTVPVGRVGQAGQRRVKCAWTARARELSSVPDDRRSGDEAPTAARQPRVRATESTGRIGSWARRPHPGRESPVRRAVRGARTPSTPTRFRRGLPAGGPESRAREMRGEPAVPRRRSAHARGA